MGFAPFDWAGDAIDWAGGAAGDALGFAGDAGEGLLEIGKSNYRATNFGDTSQYDPNRFEYGGRAGGADADASRYAGLAQQAQNRAAPSVSYGLANTSRVGQQAMAQQMRARAMGQVPSIAGMQAQQDMQRAAAAQTSAQAGARGAAGMALAQQQSAGNLANAQSQISNQAQINAANERMAAEQAAFGAYGNMRGMDEQRSNYLGQLQAQQRAQNDQYALGLYGHERGVRNDQLQAGVANQQLLEQSLGQQQTINSGVAAQRAGQEERNLQTGLGLGQDAMKMGIPAKAMGGPIMGGQPTLVGELGPEVITTSADGMVTPNHELTGLLRGRSFGGGAPAAASPSFAGASGLLGGSVGGEDKAHKDFGIRFARNPGGLY